MKRICIFCTAPFQIMTAINLRIQCFAGDKVDIYVVDQFLNADTIVASLKKEELFNQVCLIHEAKIIDRNKSKLIRWPQMAISYFRLNKVASKILDNNKNIHYDTMYISSKAFISRIVALYYAKNDFHTEFIYFDDGLGSYYNEKTFYPRFADRAFRRLLFGKKANLIDPKKMLLYEPDLYYNVQTNNKREIEIGRIPKWQRGNKYKEIVNTVFSFSDQDTISEPIIIFDGLYKNEEKGKLNIFYKKIAEFVGYENVIIKQHPRDKEAGKAGLKYYKRSDLPFELICLNTEMENKLLITVSSTSVITPVLLMGEEPYVLIINNVPGYTNNHGNACYYEFKKMYSKSYKFHEATSLEDALAFIDFYEKDCKNEER